MTTTAITGGFAVCQTRLGAKVHDPKDPGADLGPMFSQVVGTLLRLTDAPRRELARRPGLARHPRLRLRARTRDPPPLEVDVARLLDEFARGPTSVGEAWRQRCSRRDAARQVERAGRRGRSASWMRVSRADAPTRIEDATLRFPDEVWARVVGDVAVAAHRACCPSTPSWRRSCRSTSGASRASSSRPGT